MDAITALQSNRQRTRSVASTTITARSTDCGTITVTADDSGGGGGDDDDDSQFPGGGGGGGGGDGDYGDNFPGGGDGGDGGGDVTTPVEPPEDGNGLPVSNLAIAGGIGGIALIGVLLSI